MAANRSAPKESGATCRLPTSDPLLQLLAPLAVRLGYPCGSADRVRDWLLVWMVGMSAYSALIQGWREEQVALSAQSHALLVRAAEIEGRIKAALLLMGYNNL